MAGAASARELSPPAEQSAAFAPAPGVRALRRARISYRLAEPQDGRAIARLLRERPFDGAIRLTFECEPDPLAAAAIYGPVHQTIVAERGGDIVALATRAERDVFVNGCARRLGYLCQLRVSRGVGAGRDLLEGGFDFCRRLHEDGGVLAYLMSIVDDNRPAWRLLTSGRLPGAPAVLPLEPFVTFFIPTARSAKSRDLEGVPGARAPGGVRIERGSHEGLDAIVECLQRCGARHQFAPVWTAGDLRSPQRTPGLRPEDFLVARAGGRVVACLARWDQRAIRQTVVRGYAPWLSRIRPVVNLAARAGWTPHLPAPGTALPFAYLSHVAWDGDSEPALALIDRALAEARRDGMEYAVLAAAARHPLAEAIGRRFRHRRYVSRLCLAWWPGGEDFAARLDGRVPWPEVAVL